MMNIRWQELKKNIGFLLVGILIVALALAAALWPGDSVSGGMLETVDLTNEDSTVAKLVLHEISTASNGSIADEQGNSYDYIELYNGTNQAIDLTNYGLSDSEKEIKWVFPPNTVIEAKGYLLVWCSGTKQEGLYADFKLSSDGEEVVSLRKGSGKVVDAVRTTALEKGQVMARDAHGKWVIQNKPTPNYPNTEAGYEDFLASLQTSTEQTLRINEFLPRNDGNFLINHQRYGFIEIKNISDHPVSLYNYSLSNHLDESFQWQFPNITLQPGEIIVVYTSGKNVKEGELHASFKLESETGDVVLTNNRGQIMDSYSYENLANGMAMAYLDNGYYRTAAASPGYENDADGIAAFHQTQTVSSELILSEAMNNNYSYLPQNGGQYYDWIEIKNVTDHEVDLTDWYVSDSAKHVQRYPLGEGTLQPGECMVLIASGNESLSNTSYRHMNLKIGECEGLYLSKGTTIQDSLFVADLPLGYSIGKTDTGQVQYYAKPSPKKANGDGSPAVSTDPIVSQPSAVVDDVDGLTVSIDAPGTVYYTTNGSKPTTSSKIYKAPLKLKKTTVLSIMCKEPGKLRSDTQTYTYIINEKHTVPVLSLTIAPGKLSDLHAHAWTEGYEVGDGNVELLENGVSVFSIPAGLQLFGGSARGYAKKCYEVVFRKRYGAGHLEYQLFDDRDSSIYQSFVLRTGSQDDEEAIIRDLVGTSLMDEYTDVDVQAYKTVVLYINGKYWGLYFIREKVDEQFIANHYNVAATEADTDIIRIDGTYKSGNKKKYNKMLNFMRTHDLSKKANYEKVQTMINVENAADFWIGEIWTTNNDIVNCRVFANPNVDEGRFRYIFYDLDFAFYNYVNDFFRFTTDPGGMTFNHWDTTILRSLMKNKSFRTLFLERLSYNLKNTWNEDVVLAKIDELVAEIQPEIKRDRKRWNLSYDHWKQAVKDLKTYAKKRNAYVKRQARSYFGLSNAEYKKYFG